MEIKKFVHRLLSLLLCVAMVVSYLPGISIGAKAEEIEVGEAVAEDSVVVEPVPDASAEDEVVEPVPSEEPELIASGTSADGLAWALDANGHLEITGTGAMTDTPWLDYVDNIYTVTISEGITGIGEYAFNGCGYMRAVDIPDSVTAIGQFAFGYCYGLTSVVIPEGVTEIAPYTFYDCEALNRIVIPEGVTTIGNSAFLECEGLTEVRIPDSVTTINNFAFSHNYNLVTVYVGSGVEAFGNEVFVYANSLKIIRFTGDAPTFGENCFYSAAPVAYYPASNATWTEDVMQSYGGGVNWIALGELIGMNLLTGDVIPVAVGTVLDEKHIQAELIYEDDIRLTASFAELTISDYDTSEVGRQEITVSCGDQSVTAVVAVHEGSSNQLIDPALYPESDHYYGNNLNEYKTLELPGASGITLTFALESALETDYDKLYIYDGQGNLIATVTGMNIGGTSVTVPGDTVILRLYTDGSVSYYGYAFSEIRANAVNHTGEAVEAVDPTCEEDGHTAGIYCTICDALANITVLPALGHCYDGVVTPPTQDTQGYTTYTCPVCGDSYVDDYTTYDNVANGRCGENVTWVLSYEGTLTISGTGAMYEEYGVDTMDWKEAGYAIKNVVIEDGVTSIAAYAFDDCSELTSVWMADSVETIGYDAFYYCYNLTDLTIGNGVQTIKDYAFNNCYNLKTLIIPDSVQTIEYGAFQYCTALENVTIGSGVTYIGGGAFRSAQNVTALVLPDSVQTVETNAFTGWNSLTSVSIPAATSYIATGAFDDCNALMSFEVHPNNAYYSTDSCGVLFDKNQNVLIKYPTALGGEYSVPGTVTEIGSSAFTSASQLTAVIIPGSVQTIGYEAFYNCDALVDLILGEGIVTIESYAFRDCDNLKSVVIPESVQIVDYYAFQYCGKLKYVTVNGSNLTFGTRAFASCYELETITFNGDAPAFSYNTFSGVTATAYYPLNNTTWTEDVMQDYYGTITWVGIGEVIGINLVSDSLIVLCVGEELTEDHIQAELIREGDVRTPVDFSQLTISDFDNTTVGRKQITVSYGSYSDTVTVAVHNGNSNYQVDPSLYPESEHPHGHNMNETKTLTVPGANSITLYFSNETQFESNYDYLYVLDGSDNCVTSFSGTNGSGLVVTVPGDTVKLRLQSDGGVSYYGYSFSDIRADVVEHTGEQLEAVAPTCTAAGCTAGVYCTICEAYIREELPALGHSYETVTVAPTPSTQGYTTYTCTTCGDSYVDNYTTYDNVANGVCGENLTWVLSFEGTLTISGTGSMYSYSSATLPWKNIPYAVKKAVIEEGVTSIGPYGFLDCEELEEVTLPSTLTEIGYAAFNNCYALKSINIPNSVEFIGSYAFLNCSGLESIVLSTGMTQINYNTFLNCTGLKSVTIPNTVELIDAKAFYNCTSLTEIYIPDSVQSLGEYLFYGCNNLKTVYMGSGVSSMDYTVFEHNDVLTGIWVDENNQYYSSDANGVLFDKAQSTLIRCPAAYEGSYSIPDTVTQIGVSAFRSCDDLTEVTIPASVSVIEYNAFQYCNDLKKIYFTGNAPSIAYNIFDSVTAATAYYPMNNSTWTEDVLQSYYGSVTWIAVGEIIGVELENDLILLCVGETLNENNVRAELIREGGIRTAIDFKDLTVSDCDTSTTGRKEITVSYGAYTNTATVAVHEGREEQLVDPALYPESEHNYGNNLDETQVLSVPGAESITLYFSNETQFESNYDYLYVLDGSDNCVTSFSGTNGSGLVVTVPGNTVKLRLQSDGGVSYYGYSFTEIKTQGIKHTGTATEGLEPTCTEAGYTAGIYCELCQAKTSSAVLPALGHSYEAVVTDPTPEMGGYTTYTCPVCGDSYVDDYTTYDNVASGICGDDLTWVLSFEGTLTISGTGSMYSYSSATLPWKNIPYAVKKAVIEEGVTSIGQYGFQNCEELEEVTLPGTLTEIGYAAFNNCYALKSINIPNSVEFIGTYAFLNCSGLESVVLSTGMTQINSDTFLNCTGLKSVTIPNTVELIDAEAFYNCTSLTEIYIPDSVTTINYNAFNSCTGLTSVRLSENLEYLGDQAFGSCTALTEIVLPDSLTTIGGYAFRDCEKLTSINIPEGITTIPYGLFIRCTGLKSVSIPDSVTRIEEWSFAETDSLTSVTIPDSVEYLGMYSFYSSDMKSVTIGAGVTEIARYAFYCCYDLETVTFTGNAPEMAEDAFQNVEITAYYPADNATWTEAACQNYGGEITWIALGEITGIRVAEEVVVATVGTQLDISKLQVVSVHEGGAELLIDPAALTVSDCDTSTVGKKNITVSYGGYSANIVVAVHNGQENELIDPALYPESDHDYSNNLYQTKTLTVPGALSITLTFSDETLTENCDYIYILDGNGLQVASYSGTRAAGVTLTVPGDTVQITLCTDYSITYYGYSFSEITANTLVHPGETVKGKAATCTEDGYTSAVLCEICEQIIRNDRIPMMGHSYEGVFTAPTPETDGYTTYTCANCDDSFTDNYVNYYNVASGETGEVSWVLAYDGTLTISGEGRMEDYEYYWYAPWHYCGYPVKYVMIEEGVENVGEYAFFECYQIETVTLASTVINIGYSAFENCYNLTTVDIYARNTDIYDLAFRNCHALQSISIPTMTTYIGAQAFENCYSLASIVLPEQLQDINYRTFANCTALQAIVVPQNVTMIDSYAFENCDALQSISIPIMTAYIGTNALADCDSLTSITVDVNNNSYCSDECGVLFTKDMTQLIQAPGGLIGHYTVPDSVVTIWENAFANCDRLIGVTIPDTVTYIDQATFYSCDSLVDVNMPDTITAIAYRAFAECVSLEDIQIPQSVTTIVDYAFSECWNLGDVTFTGNAPSIDDWVFTGVAANAYYPADDETWTPDVMRNYGGTLNWITSGAIGILEQPLSYVTVSGNTACFFVEAVGKGLQYQWQYRTSSSGSWKNASAEGNKTPELLVPATTSRHGYEYRCKITDSVGNEVYTNPATLFVLGIAQQPVSVYTEPDGNAQFAVEATGMNVAYQWQFRSSESGQWADTGATGCDTATLTVPATTWRNGYQYRCLITDVTGATVLSDAVTLYVLGITTQPVNRTAAIGTDAVFTVEATGGDLTYQWQYRASSSGSWKNAAAEGNTTATLTVPATASRGGYQYRCIITDGAGNTVTSNAATLYVWGVNTQPSSKTVKAGTTAKFTVSATGESLTYQWQYRASSSGSWKSASATGNKTKTLSVPATTARHGYQYRCQITSNGNTIYTEAVTLYVLGITSQPAHKTVKAGTTAKFTVSATGSDITYQWQYRTSSSGSWKNTSATGSKTKTLSVAATAAKHGYQYRCKITDSAGNVIYTNVVNLNVLGIKTQPSNKTLVAGKTAKFTVSATGSDITYQWQYRTSSSGSWKNTSATGNKTKTLSIAATAAKHGYQYRCKITDSAGNVIYTDVVNLYVLGIKTQPANKTVKAGATAKFTVSATGNGLTYQWQYRTSSSGSWKNTSATGSKTKTLSVSATTSKNGYQYRCKITDSAGNVIYTNAVKLTVKK